MAKYNIKSSVRYLRKNKTFAAINLIGLILGITVSTIIFQWVNSETNYTVSHSNANNIFLVGEKFHIQNDTKYSHGTPGLLAPVLKQEYPEVENAVRVMQLGSVLVNCKGQFFHENNSFAVDPSFFNVFSLSFIAGSKSNALENNNNVIISESLATKYFGKTEVLGNILVLNNELEFTISGVFKNLPLNTSTNYELILPYNYYENSMERLKTWYYSYVRTYVLVNPNVNIPNLNNKIAFRANQERPEKGSELFLFPFKKMHLYSIDGNIAESRILYVRIFLILAFVILIIACINYVNMASAQSIERVKEASIRKILGANKASVIKQALIETFTFVFIAILFSALLVEILKPYLSSLIGESFYNQSFGLATLLIYLGVFVAVSVIVAFNIAMFNLKSTRVNTLKYKTKIKNKQALVVFQFAATIFLLFSTLTVIKQLNYISNKSLGFNTENILCLPVRSDMQKNYNVIKSELLKLSTVESVSSSLSPPNTNGRAASGVSWAGKGDDVNLFFNYEIVDFDFDKVFNIIIQEGRFFSDKSTSDKQSGILLNETAIKEMLLHNPIGKKINLWGEQYNIIGVFKDYHFNSLRSEIKPLILLPSNSNARYLYIKISNTALNSGYQSTIAAIKKITEKFNEGYTFEYDLISDLISTSYVQDRQLSNVFAIFSFFAVFISCLGLLGITIFSLKHKVTEIGVRKVNGAKVYELMIMLNVSFVKWVVLSFIISFPIAYYAMNNWLQTFAYKTTLSWWIFPLAGLVILTIALITVSWQSYKAARLNPVEALRYE